MDASVHVKVAYLYLSHNDFGTALEKMRRSVQAYNTAHHVPESDTTGYNETTTCAMMQLVATTITAYGPIMPTPDADAFCDTHPQLLTKHVLRLFYSPEHRMQPKAKTEFIEPDLRAAAPGETLSQLLWTPTSSSTARVRRLEHGGR